MPESLMEPAVNANTVLQAIRRVHRLGQNNPQRVWILSSPHTFDRFVEGNQGRKIVTQIIGVGYEYFTNFDHGRGGGSGDNKDKDKGSSKPRQNRQLVKLACQLFNEIFGLQSPRHNYDDAADIGLSDTQEKRVQRLVKQIRLQFASFRRLVPSAPRNPKKRPADNNLEDSHRRGKKTAKSRSEPQGDPSTTDQGFPQ